MTQGRGEQVTIRTSSAVLVFLAATSVPCLVSSADVAGSSDYPQIGRFQGSEIARYEVENYARTVLATGPVRSADDVDDTSLVVEGRVTRILYRVPPGVSALEVFSNFQARISEAGYTELFSGGPAEIDGYTFQYRHPVEILDGTSIGNEIHYLAAKRRSGADDVYLALLVSPHSGGDGQRVRLIAAETKAMEMQMVDADAMRSAIAETGRVALYGIYFDTDSAAVRAESSPTLQEIATLLANASALRLIVVGHTDSNGGLEYNMSLSQRRADAVVGLLRTEYGVDPSRLSSAGVGYLAPAATNETEAGRALNRRVELVEDN
jgi:outer membrane protein OmpA-like peptidoglycan-associated protein